MLRDKLKFQYHGENLAHAAFKRQIHHKERLDWWKTEIADAEEKLKGATVEFREYEHTGGKDIQPVIDPTLQQRYGQCQQKIKKHEHMVEEYDRWLRGFGHPMNAKTVFELDPDDVDYFGL